MNKREWVTRALLGKEVDRVPVGFWFHFLPDKQLTAGYDEPALIEKNLEGHRKFRDEFHPDFVKLMTDGLFYRPGSTYPPLRTARDLATVRPLGRNHPYLNACVEHAKRVREIYGDDILIFYSVNSPFLHVLKQYAGTSAMKYYPPCMREAPEAFRSATTALTEDMVNLVERVMTEAGMDGIYFALHNDNVFTQEQYFEMAAPSEREILRVANAHSPVNIVHICGYRGRENDFAVYRDYDAPAFSWSLHTTHLSVPEGRAFFTHSKSVIGGFDQLPGSLIHAGEKAEIQRFVYRLLDECGTRGFVLGADCTIPADTPIEHLIWAREACERYAEGLPQER